MLVIGLDIFAGGPALLVFGLVPGDCRLAESSAP
jgi:hypothetical protein